MRKSGQVLSLSLLSSDSPLGHFGQLKTELFYPRKWEGITIEDFRKIVDACVYWYNEKRIKVSLNSLGPLEYRESLGLVA